MINFKELFKTDFFNGIIALSKLTWKKIVVAYAIYYVATLILAGIFTLIAFLGVVDLNLFADMLSQSTPEDSLLLIQQLTDLIATPEFIISLLIFMILILIFASWNYYFAFLAANYEVNHQPQTFNTILKLSFSKEVFKLAGITFVLNIIVSLLFLIAAASTNFSLILAFFLFIIAIIVSMRFMLVIPAFIIGNYDFSSSFQFSFYHIDWRRALKFFGIVFLAMLVIIGVSLLIGLISGIFALIPIIGPIIQMAINVVIGAVIMVIVVSALVGLFYRYAQEPNNNTEEIDKIISKN